MYVKLAKTAGFCMGVRRAMTMVLEAAHKGGKPIYTYGPLIHNSQALAMLEARGIRSTTDLQEATGGTLAIRTHGATPEKRRELKAAVSSLKDCTCPYVATASGTIKKYASQGYDIVIVGDPNHPEVIAHLGYAQGRGKVIANETDAEAYQPTSQKVCLVAQTTQRLTLFNLMAEKLRAKVQDLEIRNTICDQHQAPGRDCRIPGQARRPDRDRGGPGPNLVEAIHQDRCSGRGLHPELDDREGPGPDRAHPGR
jgi:4-hydroxy-3-methylbut-2-enyl diphosphate reductase